MCEKVSPSPHAALQHVVRGASQHRRLLSRTVDMRACDSQDSSNSDAHCALRQRLKLVASPSCQQRSKRSKVDAAPSRAASMAVHSCVARGGGGGCHGHCRNGGVVAVRWRGCRFYHSR